MEKQPILPEAAPDVEMFNYTVQVPTGMKGPRSSQPPSSQSPSRMKITKCMADTVDIVQNTWRDVDIFAAYRRPALMTPQIHDNSPDQMLLALPSLNVRPVHGIEAAFRKLWRFVAVPVLLCLIGCISALTAALVTTCIQLLGSIRSPVLEFEVWFSWPLFVTFGILMATISCCITQFICPDAAGGGIPEVKTVLSGVTKPSVLSGRMLLAKVTGLILACSAGLSVGREGPFVHISCCIANLLVKLPCFNHIRVNDFKLIEIFGCACAAGVAATFGTPFGAVLFSIEITAMCYIVKNLPQAFFCAVCGTTLVSMCDFESSVSLFSDNYSVANWYTPFDMVLFVALGTVCGLLGSVFVHFVSILSKIRNRLLDQGKIKGTLKLKQKTVIQRRFYMVIGATFIVTTLTFFSETWGLDALAREADVSVESYLFKDGVIGSQFYLSNWIIYKYFMTIISVTLPLPVGLFTPVFITGGAIGRVFGEAIHLYFPAITALEPWEFAVVGSAAFSAGVTRVVSTAVILFELVGEPHLRLPLSVAILVAYFIANRFCKNIYDALIDTNGTPTLLPLERKKYHMSAKEVMVPIKTLDAFISDDGIGEDGSPEMTYLTLSSSYNYARKLLSLYKLEAIPVVETSNNMSLVGTVHRSDLKRALRSMSYMLDMTLSPPVSLGKVPNVEGYGGMTDDFGSTSGLAVPPDNYFPPSSENNLVVMEEDTTEKSGGSPHQQIPYRGKLKSNRGNDKLNLLPSSANLNGIAGSVATNLQFEDTEYNASQRRPTSSTPHLDWDNMIQYVIHDGGDCVPVQSAQDGLRRQNSHSVGYSPLQAVPLDTSPHQVMDTMHLSKVDLMFRMLKINHAYVSQHGRLIGVITRSRMRTHLKDHKNQFLEKCADCIIEFFSTEEVSEEKVSEDA